MTHAHYPLTLLYDGNCPICKLEMDNLAHRDRLNRLVFVDITDPAFDVSNYPGATLDDMQRLIHAVRPDGELVRGVEVFRLAYGAVGLGAVFAPTDWPVLRPLFDRAYAVFARNRYPVSRALAPLIMRVAAERSWRRSTTCKSGVCDIAGPGGKQRSTS